MDAGKNGYDFKILSSFADDSEVLRKRGVHHQLTLIEGSVVSTARWLLDFQADPPNLADDNTFESSISFHSHRLVDAESSSKVYTLPKPYNVVQVFALSDRHVGVLCYSPSTDQELFEDMDDDERWFYEYFCLEVIVIHTDTATEMYRTTLEPQFFTYKSSVPVIHYKEGSIVVALLMDGIEMLSRSLWSS
jgi:hypothetical protein